MQAHQQRMLKARKPKKIKEAQARQMWWDFFQANKKEIPSLTLNQKESIVKLMMNGTDPGEAMIQVSK
jgi:hypothetical protein